MQYKLLVLDIDGTLVGKANTVSPENKQALARASKSGVNISLCTGRSLRGCRLLLSELSLNGYHVFYDGALVINTVTGHEAYVQEIEVTDIKKAIEWSYERGLDIELYTSTQYFAEHENWSTDIHRKYFNSVPTFVKYPELLGRERIIKIGTVANSTAELEKIKEFCRDFSGIFNFSWVTSPSFPNAEFINIVSPQVSKGRAVTELAGHLGISRAEIIAIGDGKNDIPMFAAAGLGVAMQNSPDDLKSVAGYVTSDVEESGLAAAIEKFVLH
jgi:Cof subfamily protein (haloacid dehalogenase superfamily)